MIRSFSPSAVLFVVACSSTPQSASLNRFHYPGSVVAQAGGRYVYVVSENYDLRDASGVINTIDLQAVKAPPDAADPFQSQAIIAGKRVDSLAGIPAFDGAHLYLPTRATGALYDIGVSEDGSLLSCEEATPGTCQAALVDSVTDPYAASLLQSPDAHKYLLVGHLSAPSLARYDLNASGLTAAASVSLPNGVTSSTAAGNSLLYAGNRFFDLTALLSDGVQGHQGTLGTSATARSLLPSRDGQTVYAAQAAPNVVIALDASLDGDGVPRNRVVAQQTLPSEPGAMVYLDRSRQGQPNLLYVAGFGDGSLSILDATTLAPLSTITALGNGPFGMGVADTAHGPIVAVSLFHEDQVVLIDATAADPTAHHILARVGTKSAR